MLVLILKNMVKIQHSGFIEVERDSAYVYSFLIDPYKVSSIFPMVENVNVIDENNFYVKVKLKLGIIQGNADLKLKFVERKEPLLAKLKGEGSGLKSIINFELNFYLEKEKDNTKIIWFFEGDVSGLAASLGSPVLKASLEAIVNQVIQNLKKNIESEKLTKP
jgi:Uncharacterized conserved protein